MSSEAAEDKVRKAQEELRWTLIREQRQTAEAKRQQEAHRRSQVVQITVGELEDLQNERDRLYQACRNARLSETMTHEELWADDLRSGDIGSI